MRTASQLDRYVPSCSYGACFVLDTVAPVGSVSYLLPCSAFLTRCSLIAYSQPFDVLRWVNAAGWDIRRVPCNTSFDFGRSNATIPCFHQSYTCKRNLRVTVSYWKLRIPCFFHEVYQRKLTFWAHAWEFQGVFQYRCPKGIQPITH